MDSICRMYLFDRSILLYILLIFSGCVGNYESNTGFPDPFIEMLNKQFEPIPVSSTQYPDLKKDIYINRIAVDSRGRLVLPGVYTDKIYIFEKNGDLVLETGGTGKGPGEFEVINELFIDPNDRLYVIDKMLKKVTRFDISRKKINYIHSYSTGTTENHILQTLFLYDQNFYGVFSKMDDYETGENSFHLFKLDQKFNPGKHLLKLPGNGKMEIFNGIYEDHLFGPFTYWSAYKEWFYYITSHSTVISAYNLDTGEFKKHKLFEFEERPNSKASKTYLEKRLAPVIEGMPETKIVLEESKKLPYFYGFQVLDNSIFFKIFNATGKQGAFLVSDMSFKKINILETPSYFRIYEKSKHLLYGIDFTQPGDPQIMYIEIEKTF